MKRAGILLKLVGIVGFIVLAGSACQARTPSPAGNGECEGPNCESDSPGDDGNTELECRRRTDCPIGQICQRGECVRHQSGCQRNVDCPGTKVCRDGNCYAPSSGEDSDSPSRPDVDDGITEDIEEPGDISEETVLTDAVDGGTTETDGSCSGCYLTAAKATCVPGDSPDNCGEGGSVCSSCTGEKECVEGRCQTPPSCTPSNCDGCCRDGECLDGSTIEACGTGGVQCQNCDIDGQSCVEGECTVPCNAQSCPNGCCTDEGRCKTVQNSSYCGTDGQQCQSCDITENEVCESGSCVEKSCQQTCASGCCSANGNCKFPQSDQFCGTFGVTCTDCTPGRTCDKSIGLCTVPTDSKWTLQIKWADVPPSNKNGSSWDGFGGFPDPFIKAETNTGSATYIGETSRKEDELNPSWGTPQGLLLANVKATAYLNNGVTFTVKDEDSVSGHDIISKCNLAFSDSAFDGDVFERTCSPMDSSSNQVDVALGLEFKHDG